MLKSASLSVTLVVPVIAATLFLSGCAHRYNEERRTEWAVDRIAETLDLSADQQTELTSIKDELLSGEQTFEGMQTELYEAFMVQAKSDTIDRKSLNRLFEEKEQQFRDARGFFIAKFADLHSLLTPEQREKMVEMFGKHGGPRKRRRR